MLYFAYGSNLCVPRLRRRIAEVELVGTAALDAYELLWNKRSIDGSGKCNVVPAAESSVVWGALFRIPATRRPMLDRIEGGYVTLEVEAVIDGRHEHAFTYTAAVDRVDDALLPYAWYQRLVVSGAEALGLPGPYVDSLRVVATVEDHHVERARRNLRFMPCSRDG